MRELLEKLAMWKAKSLKDWQLFQYDEPDKTKRTKKAVKDLNGAMGVAMRMVKANIGPELDIEGAGSAIGAAYRKHVAPVQKEYADVGANDVEPSSAAMQWMIDAVKKNYGIKGRTDIADYI